MVWGGNAGLILVSIAVGLLGGVLASVLQLRDEPQAYDLLTRRTPPKTSGMVSAVLLIFVGIGIILLGSTVGESSILLAIGSALTAFGGSRFLFRYFSSEPE